MFKFFQNRKFIENASDSLLIKLNEYSRNPDYYGDDKVEDNPDGRFELIALFSTPFLLKLANKGERETKIAQKLFDKIFLSFDNALRLLGVSDVLIGKRIRKMAENFYGRQAVYRKFIEKNDIDGLSNKITLNVLSSNDSPPNIAIKLAKDVMDIYNQN